VWTVEGPGKANCHQVCVSSGSTGGASCVLTAVVVMCGPPKFVHKFLLNANDRDMIDGENGDYVYMSIRNVISDILHPWAKSDDVPSQRVLELYRHLIEVTTAALAAKQNVKNGVVWGS